MTVLLVCGYLVVAAGVGSYVRRHTVDDGEPRVLPPGLVAAVVWPLTVTVALLVLVVALVWAAAVTVKPPSGEKRRIRADRYWLDANTWERRRTDGTPTEQAMAGDMAEWCRNKAIELDGEAK